MKITIEIPDVKYDEFLVQELLEKNDIIPNEVKTGWSDKLSIDGDIYTLKMGYIVDGEVVYKDFSVSLDELNDMFLSSINYFEYDGDYGSKFELTSDESPSFYNYYKEGNLKTFLEKVVKESVTGGYDYGYCE